MNITQLLWYSVASLPLVLGIIFNYVFETIVQIPKITFVRFLSSQLITLKLHFNKLYPICKLSVLCLFDFVNIKVKHAEEKPTYTLQESPSCIMNAAAFPAPLKALTCELNTLQEVQPKHSAGKPI